MSLSQGDHYVGSDKRGVCHFPPLSDGFSIFQPKELMLVDPNTLIIFRKPGALNYRRPFYIPLQKD